MKMEASMDVRIARMINSTADYVGADCEGFTLAELAEVTLDAGRMEQLCEDYGGDIEAVQELRKLDWDKQVKLAKKVLR
jgi:hypothetical protein